MAQAQVSRSVIIRIFLFPPTAVGNTNPVKVCTRTGTPAIHAAIIQSNPALGVMECTICGFSLRNVRHNCHKDFISLIGEIWRSIFTSIHFISGWDLYILSHSGPGDDNKTTSYFFCKSESIPATKPKD